MNVTVKTTYKHLKPMKWYKNLFNEIVEDGAKDWEGLIKKLAFEPSKKQLADLKKLLEEKGKKKYTNSEVSESNRNLMMFFSIVAHQGYKQYREKDRKKTIKEWMNADRKKDERLQKTKPLSKIKCPVCGKRMVYKWSELYDRGTPKKPDEQVMFFYECPDRCKRKLIFEDGTPWISKEKNKCPICNADRKTTVTKDKEGNLYFIYECINCESRQVEKND